MNLFENSIDAITKVNEFLDQQENRLWFKIESYQKDMTGIIFPKSLYLNQFNRCVKTKTSYTFSYLTSQETEELRQVIPKFLVNSKVESKFITYEDNIEELLENSVNTRPNEINDKFLQSIFSQTFIERNNLTNELIQEKIKNCLSLAERKYLSKECVIFPRWEEVRNGLRTILSISHIDQSVQLSYCFQYGSKITDFRIQNYNPVTGYYVGMFRYEGYRFERYISKHDLNFLEVQGYEQYPENDLNEQLFEIKFNVISEGAYDEIARKSFRSLKRESKPLIALLSLYFVKDIYGKTIHELPFVDSLNTQTELNQLLEGLLGSLLKSNQAVVGRTQFHSPENDIELTYSPSLETDDSGNQFIVFSIRIKVIPFNSNPPEVTGTYYHPVIYDAGK
jgi:hypothetical protein